MTVPKDDLSRTAATADAELILRTRSGDRGAFGELWTRHYPSGMSVARSVTSSIDPDDLVQESYARIYQAIIKGGGPNGSFRAYLFTSIRNTAAAWGRSRRETSIDELDSIADPDSTEEAADEALDRGLTAQAFRSLPARWQEVLWYTEIEQMKPAEVAPLLDMKAGAVSQLAFRAREGLREAWIQAHLRSAESDSECRWTIEHLGAHSRGNLRTRDQKRIDQHLNECARCVIVAAEAKDVSGRLALVLLPLVLGVTGAAGYVATLQSTMPIVAAAAIPSSVFESSSVVADGVAPAGALGVPLDSGSGVDTAGGAGSSGSGGGAITGIGALVGAGSAALVVAGVVAAATIVPGLIDASPATSLPSAGDAGNSSISSEVEPDPDVDADSKFILEIAETPKPPTEEDEVPEVRRSLSDDAPEAEPAPPVTSTPSAGGGDGSESTKPPVETEEPTAPPESTDPPVDPPDEGDGEPDPADPNAPLSWSAASIRFDLATGKTHYSVPIAGISSETVQAFINGSTDGADSTVLDANGAGTIDLRPTFSQMLNADSTLVTFRYVTDAGDGRFVETTLANLSDAPPAESPDDDSPAETAFEAVDPEPESASTPVEESVPAQTQAADDEVAPEEPPAHEVALEEPTTDEATIPAE